MLWGRGRDDEMESVRLGKSVPLMDAMDDALGCGCLRCATADGSQNESEVSGFEKENSCIAAREWTSVNFSRVF